MAGDWIKVEHVTPDKPEIVAMAGNLNLEQDAVFGKLCRLWMWADQQSLNGYALSVTEMFIDRLCCCAGFAQAMRKVGWISGENGAITFPNFDRHNGETAKARGLALKRMRTKRLRSKRNKSVTRDRDRDRDNTLSTRESIAGRFSPPTVEQVRAYCQERGNKIDAQAFVDFYASKGWKVGRDKMVDWQASVRTWEKRDANDSRGGKSVLGDPTKPRDGIAAGVYDKFS